MQIKIANFLHTYFSPLMKKLRKTTKKKMRKKEKCKIKKLEKKRQRPCDLFVLNSFELL